VLVGNPIGVKSRLVLLRSHARTGHIMRIAKIVSAVAVFACACPGFAQQQAFQWHRGTEETVRLDPANYHGGKSYGPQGGTIHVEIEAQQPVSIFMTSAREWNRAKPGVARQHSDDMPARTRSEGGVHLRPSPGADAIDRSLGVILKSTEAVVAAQPDLSGVAGVVDAVRGGIAGC
jgi:hypothetical protein